MLDLDRIRSRIQNFITDPDPNKQIISDPIRSWSRTLHQQVNIFAF
jgi:hypothetical protein